MTKDKQNLEKTAGGIWVDFSEEPYHGEAKILSAMQEQSVAFYTWLDGSLWKRTKHYKKLVFKHSITKEQKDLAELYEIFNKL